MAARDQVAARCRPVDEYLSAGRSADLARTSGELDALNRRIEDAHKVGGAIGRSGVHVCVRACMGMVCLALRGVRFGLSCVMGGLSGVGCVQE